MCERESVCLCVCVYVCVKWAEYSQCACVTSGAMSRMEKNNSSLRGPVLYKLYILLRGEDRGRQGDDERINSGEERRGNKEQSRGEGWGDRCKGREDQKSKRRYM